MLTKPFSWILTSVLIIIFMSCWSVRFKEPCTLDNVVRQFRQKHKEISDSIYHFVAQENDSNIVIQYVVKDTNARRHLSHIEISKSTCRVVKDLSY